MKHIYYVDWLEYCNKDMTWTYDEMKLRVCVCVLLDNIRFSSVQDSILCGLVEKLNAIGNGFIVMRIRRVIGTAWSLWRFKPVRVSLPWSWRRRMIRCWWWTTRRRRRRRNRWEDKAHEDLAETVEEFHGWEIELERGNRILVGTLFRLIIFLGTSSTGGGGSYLYDDKAMIWYCS